MTEKLNFSVKAGIETQQRQLQRWEAVLKPEIYQELKRLINEKTEREKPQYKSGFDVFRGSDIDSAIVNWFILNNTFNQ